MRDVYCEHIVKRDGGLVTAAKKSALWLAALVVSFAVFFIGSAYEFVMTFFPMVFAAAIWLAYTLARNQNIEYEYALTGGELDIDKIAGRRKRTRALSVETRRFSILAPYTEKYRNEYQSRTIAKTIDASQSIKNENNWFCKFEAETGITTLLIFTPNEKLLRGLSESCRRVMHGFNG